MNATHGAVAPHILAVTQTPPATGQTQPFTATETFLIEASRSNSLIDTADGGDFNAKWTNSANFNLRRGDRISVEMCAFNAANAGGGVPTIELTGEKIKTGNETKPYCDNKVLLEIFFYLNNNNTYSVGFPAKFPTGRPVGGTGSIQTTDINWAGAGAAGNLKGVDGIQNATGIETAWGNHKIPQTRAVSTDNQNQVTGYTGWGEGFSRTIKSGAFLLNPACPVGECYNIYQFHISGQPASTYVTTLVATDVVDGIVLSKTGDLNAAPVSLHTTYTEGYLVGLPTAAQRFNGLVGMMTYTIADRVAAPESFVQLADIPITSISNQLGGVAPAPPTNRIQLNFAGNLAAAGTGYLASESSLFLATANATGMPWLNYNLPGLGVNPANGPADFGALCMDNMKPGVLTDLSWYRRRGGTFQRYNEYNIGESLPANSVEMRSFPGTTYSGEGFAGQSVYQVEPTSAKPTPETNNQGGLGLGKEGYRSGNMMRENNNKPYILTRNDYYGMGRMMPSMEGYMPYLKPQTAFILLDADELFTDLTTLANRINDILHQRLPSIGLQNDNYSNYVLNTQQYASTYQKGSSVIPYGLCNQAYYDPSVYNTAVYRYNTASMRQLWDTIPPISSGGTIKIQPANFQAGYNYALSHTNKLYDNVNLPLASQAPDIVTPQPDLITPQPDLVTPQPDIYTPPVPEVPESTTIYNSTADGSVALVSDFDVANNVSPMVLGNGSKLFTDDGGLNANYSTSHSRHATFDAGAGNHIYINPRAFEYEHSTYSMYDRMGITCSNTIAGLSTSSGNLSSTDSTLSQYLYQSSNSSPSSFWGTTWTSTNGGYGTGGGYLFPNTDGVDVKGNNNAGWINTWYKIDARYIRFWFISDGSATEPGWDILVARAVVTPLVPAIPGYYTPQPDLVTPQPDLVTPQPDLITPGALLGLTMTPEVIAQYNQIQASTYCASVKAPDPDPQSCSNICYGNMMYENMPKMMMGDCWRRLPAYPMNRLSAATPFGGAAAPDGIANLSMPVILNTKLAYYSAFAANNIFTLRTQELEAGSLLFTNLAWLGAPGPLKYDWRKTIDNNFYDTGDPLILFKQLADTLRRYEIYSRKSDGSVSNGEGPPAKPTWEGQKDDDEGWSVEFDLGQSDDAANMLGTYDGVSYQQGLYPIPANFGGQSAAADVPATGWINPVQLCKTSNIIAEVPLGVGLFPQVANPNQAAAADNWYGTGMGNAVGVGVINRDKICPSFSNSVFGGSGATITYNWSQDFKNLRGLGKVKIRSRPTRDYFKRNAAGDYINIVPFNQQQRPEYGAPIPVAVPDPSVSGPDSQCRIMNPEELNGNSAAEGWTRGTLEYFENLGLPFIPYEHTDVSGNTKIMIAIVVANKYAALQNTPNTWELGEITWGTQISVSNSFLDNHATCPMNGDKINFRNTLAEKYGGSAAGIPGQGNVPVPPQLGIARNNFNYIFMGANDPTFTWNGEKNRFEFTYFQQNTLFSAFTSEANSTAQQGESCAILNSTTRDSVFSIIDPYIFAPVQTYPIKVIGLLPVDPEVTGNLQTIPNQGIRDMEGGIGIWNIWLCPPDYTFPQNLNPVNYWSQDRRVLQNGNQSYNPLDESETPINLEQTELNHQSIIKGCVKAGRDIWEGNLLYKLGFTPEQIAEPYYGRANNRFNPNTFNNTNPNVIGTGVKPLILGNSYNNTQNPATNINAKTYLLGPPAAGTTDLNGLPKFLNGLQNNQAVAVTTLPHPLTAKDSPILTDSPFFLVYSNICETKYQSGATSQPALFYVMRNFPNQGYFYGAGSNYYQICNQDRVLSQITTEIRNPATGELAKLSPNSVLMYKVERDVVVPPPSIDAMGQVSDPEGPPPAPDPITTAIEQLTAELTGERPSVRGNIGGANSAPGGASRVADGTGAAQHQAAAANWVVEPDGETIQAQAQPQPGTPNQQQQLGPGGPQQGERKEAPSPAVNSFFAKLVKEVDRPDTSKGMTGGERALDYAIRTLISRANVGFGRDGFLSSRAKRDLPEVLTEIMKEIQDKRIPQMITQMEEGGASADDVADRIMDELGEMRFNRQGGVTQSSPSGKVGDLDGRAQLEVAPSGRGRQFTRDVARQLMDMYQPDAEGTYRMTGGGDASYYNIQRMITEAIDNGAIIGLSADRQNEFRINRGEAEGVRGRREQRGAGARVREASIERAEQRTPETRSRGGERKEGERRTEGTRRDTERRLREVNERYQNTQPGVSVFRRGRQVGRVSDRSGTQPAPPVTSSKPTNNNTEREQKK